MKFHKYDSIINDYKTVYTSRALPDGMWIATEKVHGSNLSILVTKDDVKVASRNSIIDSYSQFYRILNASSPDVFEKARRIFLYLIKQRPSATQVTLFGELAGGRYGKLTSGTRIQKGVDYSPNNFFIGFDIGIYYDNNMFVYMPKLAALQLFKDFGIFSVPVLATDTREEIMSFDPSIPTRVPALFDLPDIDGNLMEGAVFSPDITHYFGTGERIIFKKVNEQFLEKKSFKENKVQKKPDDISEELAAAIEEVSLYINNNKLSHVLSHFSDLKSSDFGMLLKSLNLEVMADYFDSTDIELAASDKKLLMKEVNKRCASLLKSEWLPTVE